MQHIHVSGKLLFVIFVFYFIEIFNCQKIHYFYYKRGFLNSYVPSQELLIFDQHLIFYFYYSFTRNTLTNTSLVSFTFQILDVERMLAKSSMDMTAKGMEHGHPVIRTLYDHMEVRCFLINIICRT